MEVMDQRLLTVKYGELGRDEKSWINDSWL